MTINPDQREALLKDLGFIMKDLLKVIKVVSLYPEDNPLPQSLRRSFAEKLVSIIETSGEIRIRVDREQLLYDGDIVYEDGGKEDRLAGLFFDTGITDFTFREALDVPEVYKLLDVIKLYVNTPNRSLDLVAMIWEKGLTNFSFGTVEDIALSQYDGLIDINSQRESGQISQMGGDAQYNTVPQNYGAIFTDSMESGEVDLDQLVTPPAGSRFAAPGSAASPSATGRPTRVGLPPDAGSPDETGGSYESGLPLLDDGDIDSGELRISEAAAAMGFGNVPTGEVRVPPPTPNTTLILNDELKLSEEEELTIAEVASVDSEFEPYTSTLELLKEMLRQENEMQPFYETVTICEKVLTDFVEAGRLIRGGQLLQHLKKLEDDLRKKKPLWAERIKEALVTAGSRDRLRILSKALNNDPGIAPADLNRYLKNFDWEALAGLTDLLGELEHEPHRQTLCDFLAQNGKNNIDLVSKGIEDKRPEVVCNSIVIMAQIGDNRALSHLARLLDHEDRSVRLKLVRELKNSESEQGLEILVRAVKDRDKEIRTEAVNSIVARRGRSAFAAITTVINQENFGNLDDDDQLGLLKAFSILGGDAAVPYLAQLILKLNPFRSRSQSYFRFAAFEALSHNRSEKGEKLLIKLSGNWRPDIRRQAIEAMHRRRELIYGE